MEVQCPWDVSNWKEELHISACELGKGMTAFNNIIVLLPRRSAKKATAMSILLGGTQIKQW